VTGKDMRITPQLEKPHQRELEKYCKRVQQMESLFAHVADGIFVVEPNSPGGSDLEVIEGAGRVALIAIEGGRAQPAFVEYLIDRYAKKAGKKIRNIRKKTLPPLMLKTTANPGGLPMEAFDQIRAGVLADRSQFFKDLTAPFYGANRPGAKVSQGLRDSFWRQGMQAGFKGVLDCIKAFSETDFTEDLKKFDVPTFIIHGDDDQIVPIGASAMLSAKLIKNAQLKIYKGAPHGLCSTHKEQVNKDLLAFFKA
jgi:Predicted hydrolases or acyltransferases (alpha/beta hydrolase superfamily)